MGSILSKVDWIRTSIQLEALLNDPDIAVTQTIKPGFEAEVLKIMSGQESFVLKIWSKSSRPDVGMQFLLLQELYERKIAVSKPAGWGVNTGGDQVLLTAFDGRAVRKVNEEKLIALAEILGKIHQINADELSEPCLPKYEFKSYFFPGAEKHEDIYQSLLPLLQLAQIRQDKVIHGDYHPNNIVESGGCYTVIDWTNGQAGDPRYDFAWTVVLLKLYTSKQDAETFSSAYLRYNRLEPEELPTFEALAVLRWMVLQRSGGVPVKQDTIRRVMSLVKNNLLLQKNSAGRNGDKVCVLDFYQQG